MEKETKQVKKISLSFLKQQVEEGMKLQPLAEYYNLPVAQMKRVLKEAGLKIRKFKNPQYELIYDVTSEVDFEDNTNTLEVEQEENEVEETSEINNLIPNYK